MRHFRRHPLGISLNDDASAMEDHQAVRACGHEEIVERENAALRPPNADSAGVNQPYWKRPRLMRIVRDVGRRNNFAHMTETPPVEWRLTPVGQRYLILRSWRESPHECRHGYCPLAGMTRFVVRAQRSWQKCRCSGRSYCRDGPRGPQHGFNATCDER